MTNVYIVIDISAEGDIVGVFESRINAEECKVSQFDPNYIVVREYEIQ